jgi:predicted AAA+ superfamily ATPase
MIRNDMFHRRTLLGTLSGAISRGKIRLLFGARQTGKTWLFRHLSEGLAAQEFNLQESGLRRRLEQDPASFAREVRALPADVRYVLVDEIQKVPALLDEVQALFDEHPKRWEFFLTGSSGRRLLRGAANLLPGRSHVYHLGPVTRWEQEGVSAHPLLGEPQGARARSSTAAPPPFEQQSLARTLLHGTLPGIMLEPDDTAAATLTAYVDTYLEEEVRREALVRDVGQFANFLKLAAIESGLPVNLAALSRESGVAQSSLRVFYDVLEQTFVGHRMRPYGRPGRKRLLTAPRFFLFDNGVRTAAAGIPFDVRLLETEGGRLLEHWVGTELLHRARYRGRGFTASSWRTASGAEVDFIWETPQEDVPIEVKWTARPAPADARHVETFLSTHPRRARRGLVVCRCEARQQLTDRVSAIPWTEL